MPVTTSSPITVVDQPTFHAVDRVLTGIAFDVHNEFGRYLDERLYQSELHRRFLMRGLASEREARITVSLDDFSKDYYLDFLINAGVILETKTVAALIPVHRAQVLNYLFLCEIHHATLLNFRAERVQHEFVSTRLTGAERRRVTLLNDSWQPLSSECRILENVLTRAMSEWGACLDPALYREAATHFLGGESLVVRDVPVHSDGDALGTQKVHLLAADIAFSITASVHRPEAILEHHRRFLAHTPLRAIQWINLNRQSITFHTISKAARSVCTSAGNDRRMMMTK